MDLRNGNHVALDHRIVHCTAREHVRERMAHEFANPQLALRGRVARLGNALMALTRHDRSECSSCPDRPVHPTSCEENRPGDGLRAARPELRASVAPSPPGNI